MEVCLIVPYFLAPEVKIPVLDVILHILAFVSFLLHYPTMYLLQEWTNPDGNPILLILAQWCIWFILFGAFFTLTYTCRDRTATR